jgi:hypothetical protein
VKSLCCFRCSQYLHQSNSRAVPAVETVARLETCRRSLLAVGITTAGPPSSLMVTWEVSVAVLKTAAVAWDLGVASMARRHLGQLQNLLQAATSA